MFVSRRDGSADRDRGHEAGSGAGPALQQPAVGDRVQGSPPVSIASMKNHLRPGPDRATGAGDHGSLKIPPSSLSMDRVSEPASPRCPKGIQSIGRAAKVLTRLLR